MVVDVTLEILARGGRPDLVKQYTRDGQTPEIQQKIFESAVYSVSRVLRGEDSHLTDDQLPGLLSDKFFGFHFPSTSNKEMLADLVDALNANCDGMPDDLYHFSLCYGILNIDYIAAAITRNMDDPKLRENIVAFVKKGYESVFCLAREQDSADRFSADFARVRAWGYLFGRKDSEQLVRAVLEQYTGEEYYIDNKPEVYLEAIKKLVVLTDRATVSDLAGESFSRAKLYQMAVDGGLIEGYYTDAVGLTRATLDRIEKESYAGNGIDDIKDALDAGGDQVSRAKQLVSERMAAWFSSGQYHLVTQIAEHTAIYDTDAARGLLGKEMLTALQQSNFARLAAVLAFPEQLIPKDIPELAPVVEAYNMVH